MRALVDGRRPGSFTPPTFDEVGGRRSRRQAARRKARSRSRQGVSEVDAHSPPAEDNAAERGAPLRGLADIGAHQEIRGARDRRIGGSVSGIDRSAWSAVKRDTARQVSWGSLQEAAAAKAGAHRESDDRCRCT
jgi:hypothetical protein